MSVTTSITELTVYFIQIEKVILIGHAYSVPNFMVGVILIMQTLDALVLGIFDCKKHQFCVVGAMHFEMCLQVLHNI